MTVLKSDSSTSQSDYITHIVPNTGQIALGVGDYTTNITYNVSNIHRDRISRPPSNARPAAVPVCLCSRVSTTCPLLAFLETIQQYPDSTEGKYLFASCVLLNVTPD